MAKVVKKGKKQRKNRISSKRWEKYKIEGENAIRTQRFCPRCGAGIFLAQNKGRLFCGKCHYTEFIKE
jgi:small subunit ribosomal protein S27Ae